MNKPIIMKILALASLLVVNLFTATPTLADEECRSYSFTISSSTKLEVELCQKYSKSVKKYLVNLKWRTNSINNLKVRYSAKCYGRSDGKGAVTVESGNQWTNAAGLGGCVEGWNDVEVRDVK